jgi:hypothetical protein
VHGWLVHVAFLSFATAAMRGGCGLAFRISKRARWRIHDLETIIRIGRDLASLN